MTGLSKKSASIFPTIQLIDIERILATEQVNSVTVSNLTQKILDDGEWTNPIWIEEETRAVMDGNHRLKVAHILEFEKIPCALFSYNMPEMSVFCTSTGDHINGDIIIEAGTTGNLLPYKSTKHDLSCELAYHSFPLKHLSGCGAGK